MVHATDLEFGFLESATAALPPHGVLLELPVGHDLAMSAADLSLLAEEELAFDSWISPPDSPHDFATDVLEDAELFIRGADKAEAHSLAIAHFGAELHSKQARSSASSVMWNDASPCASPPPVHASFSAPSSPPTDEDVDFRNFLSPESLSSDDDLLNSDRDIESGSKRGHAQRGNAASNHSAHGPSKKMRVAPSQAAPSKVSHVIPETTTETPEGKRHTHNVLERKRREDLKQSYHSLRMQIPELASAERAPTGQILIKAAEFISQLKMQEQELLARIAAFRAENLRLSASISSATSASGAN